MAEKKTAKKATKASKTKAAAKAPAKSTMHECCSMDSKLMEKEIENKIKCKIKHGVQCNGSGGCFYFLGFLGALVYYLTTATSLWEGFVGFFKAVLWPAFLVHGVLLFIGA